MTLTALTALASAPCTVVVLAKVGGGVTAPEAEGIAQLAGEALSKRGLDVLTTAERKRAVPGDPRCLGEVNDGCIEQLAQALTPTRSTTFVAMEVAGTARNVAISLRAIDLRRRLALASATLTSRKPVEAEAFRQGALDELAAAIKQGCSTSEVEPTPRPPRAEVLEPKPVEPTVKVVAEPPPAPKGKSPAFWGTAVTGGVLAATTAVLFTHNAVLRAELYRGATVVDGVTIWGVPESRARELQAIINPELVTACITGGLTLVAGVLLLLLE